MTAKENRTPLSATGAQRRYSTFVPPPVLLWLGLACAVFAAGTLSFSYDPIPGVDNVAAIALVVLAWLGLVAWAGRNPDLALASDALAQRSTSFAQAHQGWLRAALVLGVGLATWLSGWLVLDHFANSADEYALLFQAETYGHGRLVNPAPPARELFEVQFTVVRDGHWVGMYPPGLALVYAALAALGLPIWLLGPILAALGAWLILAICDELELPPTFGLLVTALSCLNGFYLFTAASYLSHHATLTASLGFVLFALRAQRTLRPRDALLAGVALGVVGVMRHPEAALIALPYVVASLISRDLLAAGKRLLLIAVGGLPFLIGLLAYYHQVTGDPFLPTMLWRDPNDTLRFFAEDPERHSARWGVLATVARLVQWSEWLAQPFLLAWALAMAVLAWQGRLRFFDLYLPILVVAYFFYWGLGWNQYGPRYYHLGLPFAVLTLVRALVILWPRFEARARAVAAAGVATFLLAPLIGLPVWALEVRREIHDRQAVYRAVERQGLDRAIVLIADSTGIEYEMTPIELIRNGVSLDGPVLYARGDIEGAAERLARAFPERALWRYTRPDPSSDGRLEQLDVRRGASGS